MSNITRLFWSTLILLTTLWLFSYPGIFQLETFWSLRHFATQYTGVIAVGCMSVAMVLALRPRWPERRLDGLDKMYRLHKWLGIGVLVVSILHWLWSEAPKWAVGMGLLARPQRGPRPVTENQLEALFLDLRGTAEGVGEWAFYAAVALIIIALLSRIRYRWFLRSHRLFPIVYLVLVFHTVILTDFHVWSSVLGWVLIALLTAGSYAAVISLFGRIGGDRRVLGTIAHLKSYPGVSALETVIDMAPGWPGHKPGQFAFAMSDPREGPHPYTIASAWNPDNRQITFISKALGDHTAELPQKLSAGQSVRVEGPYGNFTFDDDCPRQIWIGGGVGITPFIARMKHLAVSRGLAGERTADVDLFHSTADVDSEALQKLNEDASAAGIRLHILIDKKDGFLTGDKIREAVPDWREASIWFCGPTGFGKAIRRDFAAKGMPVHARFHQELFQMR